MKSASDIIKAKGGAAVFASAVGVEPNAVRVWKHRNRFPRKWWPEIIKAYPDLPLETLLKVERRA